MNFLTVMGVVLVLLGVAILVVPQLLAILVAIGLIVGGGVAVYRGLTKARAI